MNDNPSPEGSGSNWNSDEIAVDDLTCNELARLSTAFIGSYRLISGDRKRKGVLGAMKSFEILLSHQIALMESKDLPQGSEDRVINSGAIGLTALCMAGLVAAGKIDPRQASMLSMSLLESAVEMGKKTGPIGMDEAILVDVRIADDQQQGLNKVEMGMRLEDIPSLDQLIANTEFGKVIAELVDKKLEEKKPKSDDGETHGRN